MKVRIFWLMVLFLGVAHAQSTYRWTDSAGKVHYGDRPPPAAVSSDVRISKYAAPATDKSLPYELSEAVKKYPVILYVSADCGEACKSGRDYLGKRGIPFTEKEVVSAEDIEALKKRLNGGEALVPLLQVGEKTSKGYLEASWATLLNAAGYPK